VSTHHCCAAAPTDNDRGLVAGRPTDPSRPRFVRRCFELARWAIPGTVLALLPKCPVCIAAYIALGTGVGLSASTASHLRMGLVTVCLVSLAYLATGRLRRLFSLMPAGRSCGMITGRRESLGKRESWRISSTTTSTTGSQPESLLQCRTRRRSSMQDRKRFTAASQIA
jgi:hypothetical protein